MCSVRCRPHGHGYGNVEADGHSNLLGNQPGHPGDVVLQKPTRPVLALEAHRQRFDARLERSHLLARDPLLALQFAHARIRTAQRRHRAFVMCVEAQFARIQARDLVLDALEFRLRDVTALPCFLDRDGQPRNFRVHGLDLGSVRVDLAGEARKPLTAIGHSSHSRHVGALRFRGRSLPLDQLLTRHLEGFACHLYRLDEFRFLLGDALGLLFQLIGVLATATGRRCVEVTRPFPTDSYGRVDAFGERGQRKPGLRCRLGTRRQPCHGVFQLPESDVSGRQRILHSGVLFARGSLVLRLAGELLAPCDQIVGSETESGVAKICLHGLRTSRHLCLPAERFELAPQFGGEIGQPRQVGLHRIEFAYRLLLALPMLEDTRSFLDEGTSILRTRFEDGCEPPLPDDDVHLTTDA